MDTREASATQNILIMASLSAALSLIPVQAFSHSWEKPANCEQPKKICFFVPGNPNFPPHPQDGEIILVTNKKSPVTTLYGQTTVYEVDGVATSQSSLTFPPDPTTVNSWEWYSSPMTGTSYQEQGSSGTRHNPQSCGKIQYSLDSIGAFTQTTVPPASAVFSYLTQTVHAQLSLTYDPNDGTATISQLGKATRTCYDGSGALLPSCAPFTTVLDNINGVFPAQQIDCSDAHTPKVPPVYIPNVP